MSVSHTFGNSDSNKLKKIQNGLIQAEKINMKPSSRSREQKHNIESDNKTKDYILVEIKNLKKMNKVKKCFISNNRFMKDIDL